MSDDEGVTLLQAAFEAVPARVTPVPGKGALGTRWRRRWVRSQTLSWVPAGPALWRRGDANSAASGRRVRQHCSFVSWRKACPEKCRGEPRPEPDSGNPTVRDRRGALGNVAVQGSEGRSESDGEFRHGARAQLLSRPIHGGPESCAGVR